MGEFASLQAEPTVCESCGVMNPDAVPRKVIENYGSKAVLADVQLMSLPGPQP
jgi:hypothetical protein